MPGPTEPTTAKAQAINLTRLNEAAVALHRAGHVPIIGVNMAFPMVEAAGGTSTAYEELVAPVSLALVERCDPCLRIGGPSRGPDNEVKLFEVAGRPVYRDLRDVRHSAPEPLRYFGMSAARPAYPRVDLAAVLFEFWRR